MRQLICHLIDANLDTNFFRSLAQRHDRERFPVMIGSIAPEGLLQKAMRELGIPTFSLGATGRWQYPLTLLRLARMLRRKKVSILHAHCFDPTLVGLLAARVAGVSFVFTRHHSDHNIRLNAHWHTRIDSWCARNADRVIAVSKATRQIMMDFEKVAGDQISVVYNGMEPLREADPERVSIVRQELGLFQEPVCLILGRLHEEKGHRFLFDAVPQITSRVGKVTFLVAGEGPHRAEYEAQVRTLGLGDTVRFLGRREDVSELISLSTLVVMPSLAESFGFSALEAMSLGKPVVASSAGGIPEVVIHQETGLLVPPADSNSLADATCQVLTNLSFAGTLGLAGKRRSALFTFDRMMSGYEAIYERINLREPIALGSNDQPSPGSKKIETIVNEH